MTPLETEANPNIRVGPLRWGRPGTSQEFCDWHQGALMSDPYGLRISLQKNIYFQCFVTNAKRSSPQKCRFFDWPQSA